MAFDSILEQLPEFYQDVKANIKAVLSQEGAPDLTEKQIYGAALTAAYATRNEQIFVECENACKTILTSEETKAIKIVATTMAMNNVYYRFVEFVHDTEINDMRVGLYANFMRNTGISRLDFGIYALVASAINACSYCVKTHMTHVTQYGLSKSGAQSAIKIAAAIYSLSQALIIEKSTTTK